MQIRWIVLSLIITAESTMNYKPLVCLLLCNVLLANGLSDLRNTKTHKCIRCLCHAVSGCYMLQNCARYTINMEYWETAGSPVLNEDDPINEDSYKKCMRDENCILHTINNYTSTSWDCNCDGEVNCEDRLATHFNKCGDPMSIPLFETRRKRYRSCSGEEMAYPTEGCIPLPPAQ